MEQTKEPIYENGKLVGFRPKQAQGGDPAASQQDQGLLSKVGHGIADVGRGLVNGVQEGISETAQTIGWLGDQAMFRGTELLTGTAQNYYPGAGWLTEEEVKQANEAGQEIGWQPIHQLDQATDIKNPYTMIGNIASGATQFLAGYGIAGKALKAAKVAGAATKAGKAAQAMGQGAIADFASFDAHEERLSDFLRDNVGLRDPITEFLAADENDSVLEGKLKNALEGLGLGVATDGMVHFLKLFKQARKVKAEKGAEAAADVVNEGMADAQLPLFDSTTDPNLHKVADGAGPDKVIGGKKPEADPKATADAGNAGEVAGQVTAYNRAKAMNGVEEPKPVVNTKSLQEALETEMKMRTTNPGGFAYPKDEAIAGDLFNFGKMDSDVSVKEVLNMATDSIMKFGITKETTFEKIADDATDWVASWVDTSKDEVMTALARQATDSKRQPGLVIASKQIAQSLGREIENLAEKIHLRQGTEQDRALLVRRQAEYVELAANMKSVIRGAAQTTAAGRIHTHDALTGQQLAAGDIAKQIDELARPSMENVDQLAAAIVANKKAGGDMTSLLRITETGGKSFGRKTMDVINEYYINSILSGPKTHGINILSNGINSVLLPAEKMLGGAVALDKSMIKEGFSQYNGMRIAFSDSAKAAWAALKADRNILDPEAAILEANGVNYHAIHSTSSNPVVANTVNLLGTAVRAPSRFLLSGDEFFKQLNYRSSVYARLTNEASDLLLQGRITKEEMSKYVADRMQVAIGKHGEATSMQDLNYAREATFTQPLRRDSALGSAAARVQDFTNAVPVAKMIIPFVRTPMNVLKAALQRTPILQFMSKTLREDLASGVPSRVASARGKIASGLTMYGAAAFAAAEGVITGSGPTDPALRAQMMETGWRPYSIRMSDGKGGYKYVEYRRVEPFATLFGTVADIIDISGHVSEMEQKELASAAIIAFANNVSSKSFLQGGIEFAEMLSDPDRYGEKVIQNKLSGLVPYSAFNREVRKAVDPASRDVQSLTDAIKNTVPGYSKDLPARRSWITGEAILYPKGWGAEAVSPVGEAMASINPITATDWKQDKVLDELAQMEHAIAKPTRTQKGVELTPQQYSRFLELHGRVRIGRQTLHQRLETVFDSKLWQAAKAAGTDADSVAASIVRKEVTRYRDMAFKALMAEDPQVLAAAQQVKQAQAVQRRQVLSGLTNVADLAK